MQNKLIGYLENINNKPYQVSQSYTGASGKITFDKNGDLADSEYKVMKSVNGTRAAVNE